MRRSEIRIPVQVRIFLLRSDDIILSLINEGKMFLDAPRGMGKTFLIYLLLAKVRSDRKISLAVSSFGIAASLLEDGRSAH